MNKIQKFYAIKPSHILDFGSEATEYSVLSADEIECCARGWELPIEAVKETVTKCRPLCRINSHVYYWNPETETIFSEEEPDVMAIDFYGNRDAAIEKIKYLCEKMGWTCEWLEEEDEEETNNENVVIVKDIDDHNIAIGQLVTLAERTDIMTGESYYILYDSVDGLPSNMDRSTLRYHGWRGTTNNISIYACGLRRIEDFECFRDGYFRVTVSDDLKPDED